ncbi:hypothetical protein NVP1205O_28 [Vibrio phage 1.205.O._10N.222.51.A7]|nr:hypothetical protein NVP1205O_28 [Vibrio phage 1.205.O._10N.222.51.A7]
MMHTINNTEIELNICGTDVTVIVSGFYFAEEKATSISPPKAEQYELDLELETGEDISELLCIEHVFKAVIKKLYEANE